MISQRGIGNVVHQAASEANEDDESPVISVSNGNPVAAGAAAGADSNEDNERNVLGVMSVADMSAPVLAKLRAHLCAECAKRGNGELARRLETKRVWLCVNERFINIPFAISVPMFESLLADLNSRQNDEDPSPFASSASSSSSSRSNQQQIDYWLFMARCFAPEQPTETEAAPRRGRRSQLAQLPEQEYANPEEELTKHGDELLRLRGTVNGDTTLRVFMIDASRLSQAIQKIKSLV